MNRSLNRRTFLAQTTAAVATASVWPAASVHAADSKVPTAAKLPRWRGFNLLEKFTKRREGNPPFSEKDFQLIADLGFDFVRLPMSYLCWTDPNDWRKLSREEELKHIDQAVEFGRKHRVHVNINFHRAPGYCVNPPKEPRDLWKDDDALDTCGLHWAAFAKRYKGIPNNEVSFDLLNEPADIPEPAYAKVARHLVAAIRAEDANRLIIADGLKWGTQPVMGLADLGIGQSTRGYSPMEISHYKASWVNSEHHPKPVWPRVTCVGGTLASPGKGQDSHAIVVDGPFAADTELRLHVGTVSSTTALVVEAGGKTIFTKEFKPGAGEGEWKKSVFKQEWNVFQNVYDRDYMAVIPAGAKQIKIFVPRGDWVQLTELGFKPAGAAREDTVLVSGGWSEKPEPFRYTPGVRTPFTGLRTQDAAWLWKNNVEPWQKLEARGVGVHVGEWGAFNKTPHDVALRWMEDCLGNWKRAGWGWAMWNFRGAFGPLDSGRADVTYEDFYGHKLDRAMLALIQRY